MPVQGFTQGCILYSKRYTALIQASTPYPCASQHSNSCIPKECLRTLVLSTYLSILLHIYAYPCVLNIPSLHTLAYSCILLHTLAYSAYSCILLHTLAYSCILLHTLAYSCILLHTPAYSCILLHTLAYSCILLHTLAYSNVPSEYSCIHLHTTGANGPIPG